MAINVNWGDLKTNQVNPNELLKTYDTGVTNRMISEGDFQGAQKKALLDGDTELAKFARTAELDHRNQVLARLNAAAPVALRLRQLPESERAAGLQLAAPVLRANGWTDDEIAQANLTDAGLDAYINDGQSFKDLLDRQETAAALAQKANQAKATLDAATERARVADSQWKQDYDQRERANNAPKYDIRTETGPDGRETVIAVNTKDPFGQGLAQTSGTTAPRATSSQIASTLRELIPGIQLNSGTRTAEHNKKVGGVPDSQHIPRDGETEGTAYDVERNPNGMSAKQLEAALRAKGLDVEVIDEVNKNHFHIQGTRRTTQPSQGSGVVFQGGVKTSSAKETWRDPTPAEIAASGYPAGTVFQINDRGEKKTTYTPPASTLEKPLSEKDRAAARTKLASVKRLQTQIDDLEALDPKILGGFAVGSVPSNLIGGESARYDAIVAQVRKLITSITRIPGIGAQSDYEAGLEAATAPERTQNPAGRKEAYNQVRMIARDMVDELTRQAEGNLDGNTGSSAPAAQTNNRAAIEAEMRKRGLK